MANSQRDTVPVLIMIRGLPGSGKSYITHALQELIGKDKLVILDPDMIDYNSQAYTSFSADLTSQDVDAKLHPYRFLRAQAYAAIKDHRVIVWNQAFTHLDLLDRTIKNLQNYATELNITLPAFVVEVAVDALVARQRVAERAAAGGHNVLPETFERFINDYKSFSGYGYEIVAIQGTDDVNESVAKINAEIKKVRTALSF